MMMACKYEHNRYNTIKLFLEAGASCNIKNYKDESVLDLFY